MWDPLVTELVVANLKERREAALPYRVVRRPGGPARGGWLRRFLAARLVALAAIIDSEAAEAAVHVQEGHGTAG